MSSVKETIFNDLDVLIRSRYPIIYLTSYEEDRVIENIKIIAEGNKKKYYSWTITKGLIDEIATEDDISDLDAFNDPLDILQYINLSDENAIFVLKDFHSFMDDFTVVRKLRDLYASLKLSHKNLIILSPFLNLPTELNKEVTVLDIPLPGSVDFLELISDIKENNSSLVELDKSESLSLSRAAHDSNTIRGGKCFLKAIVCQKNYRLKDWTSFLMRKNKSLANQEF